LPTRTGTRTAGPTFAVHLAEGGDELLHLVLAEFAVIVGIVLKRVGEHPLGIGTHARSARSTTTRTTTGSAWSTTLTTGTAASGTTSLALTTGSALSAALSLTAGTGLAAASLATGGTTSAAGTTWSAPLRTELLFGDLAIVVLVELGERGRRVLQFVGGDHTVMIGIEGFDHR
jgi:hypothetical protein